MPLPIEPVLPDIAEALMRRTEAVLQAPPGAGKTTLVPLALRNAGWLGGQRIVMLEPRRLAARAAARRMAHLLGEPVGQTVGYRVRMDARVSRDTRIEVVTEGVLTRFLQDDPSLRGIGLLIFDEFHERSLHADVGLALALECQSIFRPDLRLLVMSATLERTAVSALLDDAPVIASEGASYPVETHYLERRAEARIETIAARTVRKALAREPEGDVLVFLPGAGEIRRTAALLGDVAADVYPLFGSLPQDEQDRAIAPSESARRKVVLSTDIAETSLTIEGVRIVIDSGLMRVPRFSPRSGMTRLATIPVSRASADQRRGRAGRIGPGLCYRLWTELDHQHLRPHSPPEIAEADLAPLALELARWGARDPLDLRWMDPPPAAAFAQARDLLQHLGALDGDGGITDHGRDMAEIGLHPRLAHLILSGVTLGQGRLACEVAALLSERDIFRGAGGPPDADLRLRVQALHDLRTRGRTPSAYVGGSEVHVGAARRVLKLADHWMKRMRLDGGDSPSDIEATGLLVAFAYPDRIAQRKPGREGRFRMRNGRSACLADPQLLSDAAFVVIADLDGRSAESRVYLAAPVSADELAAHFGTHIETVEVVEWEDGGVRAREQQRLGALILRDAPLRDPNPDRLAEAMLYGIRERGLGLLPWTKAARRLQERLVFLHRRDPAFPDAADAALEQGLDEWLKPHLYGMKRAEDLQNLDLPGILLQFLSWEQRTSLDERAPTHVIVPSGSRIPIDYSDPAAPVLAVRLQEMFGLTQTPTIDRGRVPLTLHLLSPAHRPVQVTQDLESFWSDTYFDVRKDLRGRYPKHYWPEDPLEAAPTNRAKPRK